MTVADSRAEGAVALGAGGTRETVSVRVPVKALGADMKGEMKRGMGEHKH